MKWGRGLAAALAAAVPALAAAVLPALAIAACAGEEATRPRPLPPVTTAPAPDPTFSGAKNVDAPRIATQDAAPPPAPARPPLPEPSFGSESAKPGDTHAFRLAMALRAMRASQSGTKILKTLSALPAVVAGKSQLGIDPFADGEWLLVYGPAVAMPGPNANVFKHGHPDAEIAKAITDAGLVTHDDAGVWAELYGVRDVLVRPQPGVLALVPGDRARDIAAALTKPIDPGVKPGELARAFVGEPARLVPFLPADVVRANVSVKLAADGGIDASADADCPDAASCKTTATKLDELVRRQNSILVRLVLQNVLASFAVRADGAKLRATLHARPDQVDAVLNTARAYLGLPAMDAADAGTPP